MRLISFDPSSTRTGYAIFDGPSVILEAGYLSADRKLDAISRIHVMCAEAVDLLVNNVPDRAVLEITSGKVGRRHRGAGAGLAVYGMAVGAMSWALRSMLGEDLEYVPENAWTRGVPKRIRTERMACLFPEHREAFAKDTGGDVADAIGLGVWLFSQRSADIEHVDSSGSGFGRRLLSRRQPIGHPGEVLGSSLR